MKPVRKHASRVYKTSQVKLSAAKKATYKKRSAIVKRTQKHARFISVWFAAIRQRLTVLGAAIVRVSPPWLRRCGRILAWPFRKLYRRIKQFMGRRPHRSFRLTRRRDYKRSLALPGYWSFTSSVLGLLWKHKGLFGGLIAVYFVVALAIGGFGQQDAYTNLSTTLNQTGGDLFKGNWGQVSQAGLLLVTSVTTGLTPNVTQAQSVFGGFAAFFAWLATVWALRNTLAGRRVRVRDAIYSSGSPVISTVLVAFTLTLQLFPIAIATLIYQAAIASELVSGGVEQMILWLVLMLLGVLSLYWVTSTIIALVVVTLPGMYPFQAIRTAGDLVIGRRLRVLLRLVWVALITIVVWFVVAVPVILLDAWIKKTWAVTSWVPTVPVVILFLSSITLIWLAAYIYLLYRKVVDDDASPA